MRINSIANYNYVPKSNLSFNSSRSSVVNNFKNRISLSQYIKKNSFDYIKYSHMKYGANYKMPYEIFLAKHIPVLNKLKFTEKDYNNLTKAEKIIFREILKKEEVRVKTDAKIVFKVADEIKQYLDKKYPNGYKLVSLGNSPAPFVESMSLLGADTTTLPFSMAMLNGHKYPYDSIFNETYNKKDWIEYLNHYGIDIETLNKAGKKLIFTDYKYSGRTLHAFEEIIENIGYGEADVVSLYELLNKTNLSKEKIGYLERILSDSSFKYLSEKPSPKYVNINKIDIVRHPEAIDICGEGFASKLLKFLYYDNKYKKQHNWFNKILNSINRKG